MTHLVGSGKNQIPTNQELGNLAFQNGDVKAIGVGDLTATDIQVNANTTSIKPTLNLDFANFSKASDYIDPRVLFTSTDKTWNGRQNYTSFVRTTNSIPRYEFVGEEATGLLCESAGSNHASYSNAIQSWTSATGAVLTSGQPAPDGSNTACLINDNVTNNVLAIGQNQLTAPVANEIWCWSLYVKKTPTPGFPCLRPYRTTSQEFRLVVNTTTGEFVTYTATSGSTLVNAGVIDCGGWWRIWISGYFLATVSYCRNHIYPAWNSTLSTASSNTQTNTITCWGMQAERGSYPTSYIPCPATTITNRAIDEYRINDISSFYNQSEGTIVTEFVSKDSLTATVVGFEGSSGADNNSIRIRVGSAGGLLGQIRYSNTDVSLITNAYTPSTNYKVAYAYKQGDSGMCVNGGIVQTLGAAYIPTVSYMTIGLEYSGATPINSLDGNIKKITYYPKRLSNAELVELTK